MKILTELDALEAEGQERYWTYCTFDSMVTLGVEERLRPMLIPETTERVYAFERACQNPAMAMMRRGIKVDVIARDIKVNKLNQEMRSTAKRVDKLPAVRGTWDGTELETGMCPVEEPPPLTKAGKVRKGWKPGPKRHKWPRGEADETRKCERCGTARLKRSPLNPNSPQQLDRFFYTLHGVKPEKNNKGEVSTDKECLLRIGKKNPELRPVTDMIGAYKNMAKQRGFLKSKLTHDERMRQSVNVGAAWTGRYSSSSDPMRFGTNIQNIAPKLRDIFVADPGMELGYFDLEQSDSRVVAYDADDEAYIQAHESGNVHVMAARIFFPSLDWTGDAKKDKALCKDTPLPWDADHSVYDQSKRNQHGLNFGLSPNGLAYQTHCPLSEARLAYKRYFDWAPRVKERQYELRQELEETGVVTNPLGRRCVFFGRKDDPHTFKQVLSFIPQSMTADVINLALWRVWKELDFGGKRRCEPGQILLLAQIHDAILFQANRGDEEAFARVKELMEIPIPMRNGRMMTIPVDPARGLNWGKRSETNPDGMEG